MKWRKILQGISRQTENSKTEVTLCSDGSSGKHSTLQYSLSTAKQNYILHYTVQRNRYSVAQYNSVQKIKVNVVTVRYSTLQSIVILDIRIQYGTVNNSLLHNTTVKYHKVL